MAIATYAEASRLRVPKPDQQMARIEVRHAMQAGTDDPRSAPFHLAELDAALRGTGGKAPGKDGILPAFQHLPAAVQVALLSLLNRSWQEGKIPSGWRTAIITPIAKKGKPSGDPSSYRPVSLLSCVG